MTYTEKELDQFLHGISLSLLSKKSAQHWRYDEETAKEIEWLEVLERKVRADKADRKTEPNCSEIPNNCDTCKHNKLEWYSEVCDGCSKAHSNYEPKDEPQTMVYPQVDGITPSVIVKDKPQTDNLFTDKDGDVWEWRGDAWYCISGDEPQTVLEAVLDRQTDEDRRKMAESVRKAIKDEPQTDCDHKCIQTEIGCEKTDCPWK